MSHLPYVACREIRAGGRLFTETAVWLTLGRLEWWGTRNLAYSFLCPGREGVEVE